MGDPEADSELSRCALRALAHGLPSGQLLALCVTEQGNRAIPATGTRHQKGRQSEPNAYNLRNTQEARMLKMFGFGKAPPTAASASTSTTRQTTEQRELVRMALHDTLRKHGLQSGSITCDILPAPAGTKDAATLVLLNVVQWHDALMDYAPALEQELRKTIERIDSSPVPATYNFAWKFAPECGCPHASMPRPDTWATPGRKTEAGKEEAKTELHRKFDKVHSEYDHRSSGFAPTEPGTFR